MKFYNVNIKFLSQLTDDLKISKRQIFIYLTPYYVLTLINTLLEGIGMVLLVNLFTDGKILSSEDSFLSVITKFILVLGGQLKMPGIIPFMVVIFFVNFLLRLIIAIFDGYVGAYIREKLQRAVYEKYLYGDWANMRNFRVGDAVGTNTTEAIIVTKYIQSAISSFYFLISATATAILALSASFKVAIILGLISLPLMILMKKIFTLQAQHSKNIARLRNEFSGSITDRFNGLLQVHVDDNYEFHVKKGLETEKMLTLMDIYVGFWQAIINSFNLLLPLLALTAFYIYLLVTKDMSVPDMSAVASVGILGMRVSSQLNGAVSAFGNLSRLSGSLHPVLSALSIPQIRRREKIPEKIAEVELSNIQYDYENKKVLKDVNVIFKPGHPLVLSGRSGQGKTTLANIIAGLYFPKNGKVLYFGVSGKAYSSLEFKTTVGFVTQDIYLFRDSLRVNLAAGRERTDDEIWQALKEVDADHFVLQMGGLDTESAEAGRSLSGGQRRRLGIARVLLSGCEVLIFDEVTAGLDQANKQAVIALIERLSKKYSVVIISHDELNLDGEVPFSI